MASNVETKVGDDTVSSLVAVRLIFVPFTIVGASLTGVTLIDADSTAVLNAVVPPLLETFTPKSPLLPDV